MFDIPELADSNHSFENHWKIASKIPGYITINEGRILYLVTGVSSSLGNVIEIGSYSGKSSYLMAKSIQERGNKNGKLNCVDNFSKSESSMFPFNACPKKTFTSVVKKYGLTDKIDLHEMDSYAYLSQQEDNSAGLIFLDGKHTKNQISNEFPEAFRAVKENGLILIHDFKNPSVENAYTEWLIENVCQTYNTIFIIDSSPAYNLFNQLGV